MTSTIGYWNTKIQEMRGQSKPVSLSSRARTASKVSSLKVPEGAAYWMNKRNSALETHYVSWRRTSKPRRDDYIPESKSFVDVAYRVDVLRSVVFVDLRQGNDGVDGHAEDNSDDLPLLLGRSISSEVQDDERKGDEERDECTYC